MHKQKTRITLLLACAAAAVAAVVVPAYAPAQNDSGTAAPTQEASTRPLALPGPAQAAPARPDALSGETDPTAIERVGLSDLSLSAIVTAANPEHNIAMLELEGVGYIVQKGSRIGSNNGVVREITATTVVVEEPGGETGIDTNTIELKLPQ
ncbi:MAG: hypothetical protein LBR80_13990 [Deltaproteobacteria bacterium]|jgi:Tfp pilus assembly protein PilP|nr:hypothetical protein [Deltaproteobacteria bacterium]